MEGPVVLAGVLGEGPVKSAGETLIEKTLYYKDDPTMILIPDDEREFARWRIGYRTQGNPKISVLSLYEIRDESYGLLPCARQPCYDEQI
jgi:hypothetical protein